ncbi:MAG TPA: serine hydrolase [Flavisolibacter sp.]|nr:serine hydrolase [Flavisolibacter sp.]
MKLPAAVLALQKLNELGVRGLNRNTTMITGKAAPGQTPVYNDPSSNDGRPTVAQYIPKIFLVSDNDAYNRLYKFVGQEYLNCALYKMGYNSVQLQHRLQVSLTEEQNRLTNPVTFFDTVSQRVYTKVAEISNPNFLPGKRF